MRIVNFAHGALYTGPGAFVGYSLSELVGQLSWRSRARRCSSGCSGQRSNSPSCADFIGAMPTPS